MDGSSDPGSGGRGGCGEEYEVNDDGECKICVMWREIFSYDPSTDGEKKFLDPDGPSSSGSGSDTGGECEMNDDGAEQFHAVASDDTSDDGDSGCGGECEMNDDGAKELLAGASDDTSDDGNNDIGGECEMNDDGVKQFLAVASDGSKDTSRPYILGQQTPLPLQVERKVQEKLREIRSELPILVRVMTATNAHGVGRGPCEMVFCMEYASACLPNRTHPLLLQMEGKSKLWHATLGIARQNQRRVYHGWKGFARDNELNSGDICLFELAGSNTPSLAMKVYLIRKSEAQM